MKILDKEPESKNKSKSKAKPIKFEIPKITEKIITETITHSTLIMIDGKYISLSITKHLGYQKPYQMDLKIIPPKGTDLFEDLFYWPLESYTNPKLNAFIYKIICETNYHYQSGLMYELQWEIIHVGIQNGILTLSNSERSYISAIPPNGLDEPRYDYITDDGHYKYGCKPGEYKGRAIEIITHKKSS